jgi:hypothetical protein
MRRKALAASISAALLYVGHLSLAARASPVDPICVDTQPLVVMGQQVLPAVHKCTPTGLPPPPTAP